MYATKGFYTHNLETGKEEVITEKWHGGSCLTWTADGQRFALTTRHAPPRVASGLQSLVIGQSHENNAVVGKRSTWGNVCRQHAGRCVARPTILHGSLRVHRRKKCTSAALSLLAAAEHAAPICQPRSPVVSILFARLSEEAGWIDCAGSAAEKGRGGDK